MSRLQVVELIPPSPKGASSSACLLEGIWVLGSLDVPAAETQVEPPPPNPGEGDGHPADPNDL